MCECLEISYHRPEMFVSFFWSTLSPLGLNTEVYSENLCILSECGEIQTKNTPNKNTFYAVVEVSFVRT